MGDDIVLEGGWNCGARVVIRHGKIIVIPTGPNDGGMFLPASEPVGSLQSLSPAMRQAVIAVLLGGVANEIKDAEQQAELRKLSVHHARLALQDLKSAEPYEVALPLPCRSLTAGS